MIVTELIARLRILPSDAEVVYLDGHESLTFHVTDVCTKYIGIFPSGSLDLGSEGNILVVELIGSYDE
jgi:hypothetical protein